MKTCETVLAAVQKIKFFTEKVFTKTKFHITIGHQTCIGLAHFFSVKKTAENQGQLEKLVFTKGNLKNLKNDFEFDFGQKYIYEDELVGVT